MYVHTAADVWRTGNPSPTLSFVMNCIRSFIEQGNKDYYVIALECRERIWYCRTGITRLSVRETLSTARHTCRE